MSRGKPELFAGISIGLNSSHSIIVREEKDGRLRLMGEARSREVVSRPDEAILMKRIHTSLREAIKNSHVNEEDILTVGIALPGQIDVENGSLLFSPLFQVEETPLPLLERLKKYINIEHITLLSNNDAQGLGEQRIGIGKGIKDLVYLRIGYNVGACTIINEKLYTGADNLAGEFGHMVVNLNGPTCKYCHNNGCLDVLVSREAIADKILALHKGDASPSLERALKKKPIDINSVVIADALDQEDVLAREVILEAAEVLGVGIANVINFLNPHMVILGGDVIDEIDLYFERAVEVAHERTLHASMRNTSIVRGQLGTTAAAYGTAVFAKERLLQKQP